MELRDRFIKEMVEEGIESEETIQAVIADAFRNLNSATLNHSTVELSGLGTFVFNKYKAPKYLRDLERNLPFIRSQRKKDYANEFIEYIKKRI